MQVRASFALKVYIWSLAYVCVYIAYVVCMCMCACVCECVCVCVCILVCVCYSQMHGMVNLVLKIVSYTVV